MLDLLRPRLEQDRIEARVPRPLPKATCDRVRVGEVFSNLIVNAVKYNDKPQRWLEVGYIAPTERGGVSLPTGISPEATVFYVSDNGIGIPARHLELIFRIYKRLHAREAFGGGTGAGLTIAKKIVERHGGQLWVASTPGVGATFYFTLEA